MGRCIRYESRRKKLSDEEYRDIVEKYRAVLCK